jgi:hypothetical protein
MSPSYNVSTSLAGGYRVRGAGFVLHGLGEALEIGWSPARHAYPSDSTRVGLGGCVGDAEQKDSYPSLHAIPRHRKVLRNVIRLESAHPSFGAEWCAARLIRG